MSLCRLSQSAFRMKSDRDSYIQAGLDLLRSQIARFAHDEAAAIVFAQPRFATLTTNLKVDFSFEPHISPPIVVGGKPAAADLPSAGAAQAALQAHFEAAAQSLLRAPPFDAAAGPFFLNRIPRTTSAARSVVYRQVCSDCSGKSVLKCKKCRGQGGYTCTSCDGRRETDCAECRASGQTTSFSGQLVTCPRCSGARRLPCDPCSRTGRMSCHACKGKRTVPCKPCSATGAIRSSLTLSINTNITVSQRHAGPGAGLLPQIFEAFGGIDALEPGVGRVTSHSARQGSVAYTIDIPSLSISASLAGFSSACVVAGALPRVVQSGDFLEKAIAGKLDALEQLVSRSHPVTCDPLQIRSALRDLLEVESNRSCITPTVEPPPGITPTYSAKLRKVVLHAIKQVEHNTMLRFMSAGSLAAPLVYIVTHRLLAMPVLDSISIALGTLVVAYIAVLLSMRVTLRSLRINQDAYRFISS